MDVRGFNAQVRVPMPWWSSVFLWGDGRDCRHVNVHRMAWEGVCVGGVYLIAHCLTQVHGWCQGVVVFDVLVGNCRHMAACVCVCVCVRGCASLGILTHRSLILG